MTLGPAAYLYERQLETEALELALENARGGDGGVIVLLGPAGIGKSRLIAAAADLARALDLEVLAAAGAEPERDFPFGVALQLFERVVRQASARQRARLLQGAAGLAGPLFGGDPAAVGGTSARLFPLVHGLFWLLSNLAERGPLMVAVDDLHWCDQESLRVLLYLAQRISALRALLVVSARPGERVAAEGLREQLIEHPQARVLRLAPLSDGAVRAVSETELGVAVGDEFVTACARVTGGNPFFLRELLAALQSYGIDAHTADAGRVLGLAPEALTQRLLVRVMRLAEPAPSVARALAVLGDRPSLAHAATLAGVDPAAASDSADALARAEILDPTLLRSGGPASFKHPIVRAAIYHDQSAAERARGHAEAAKLLMDNRAPVEEIATHLLRTRPGTDPRAAGCLVAAARRAGARGSPGAAASLLGRALEEQLSDTHRGELLCELAAAEIAAGHAIAAEQHAAEANALLPAPHLRAGAQRLRGRALGAARRCAQAADAFEQGISEVSEDSEFARDLRASFVTMCMLDGSLRSRGLPHIPKIVQAANPTSTEHHLIAWIAGNRALSLKAERDEVRALASRAWGNGALLQADGGDGEGWAAVCVALGICEYFEEAIEIADVALDETRRRGSISGAAIARLCRAFPLFERGQILEAIAELQTALQAREAGWGRATEVASAFLARSLIERDQLAEAAESLKTNEPPPARRSFEHALLLEAHARVRLAQGDASGALTDARAAGNDLHDLRIRSPYFSWRATAARAALALDDRAAAHRLIDEELELSRRLAAPAGIARGLRIKGLIQGGTTGLQLLEQAAHTIPADPPRLERTRALVDLGSALRRANKRAAARQPLTEAHQLAHSGGATLLAERARIELAALGARPRKEPAARDQLTASEHRVAEMATRGMTNKQIAQTLFITVKAVEWHLHHAYLKLNITSRKQLAQALTTTQ
jgi:DNA-binding CsgD family transcriptional regulator/tetratricopeptide (TPR) repeat protein